MNFRIRCLTYQQQDQRRKTGYDMTKMIEVRDDQRILRFDGVELGFSSSRRRDSPRWIEFTLYKTNGDGQYVLSRIGVSRVYHTPDCRFSTKSHIEPVSKDVLEEDAVPCHEVPGTENGCRPDEDDFPLVCPEEDKTWARVFKTPEALFDGLMKHDRHGNLYMTGVARRLLAVASEKDPAVAPAEQVQTIT